MKKMIEVLVEEVNFQKEVVDMVSQLIEKKSKRVDWLDEESVEQFEKLRDEESEERERLKNLRHSLMYLRMAAGHKNVDSFFPEKF